MTTAQETEVQLFSSSAKLTTSKIIHLQKVWKSYIEKNANCIALIFPYINGIESLKKKSFKLMKVNYRWTAGL